MLVAGRPPCVYPATTARLTLIRVPFISDTIALRLIASPAEDLNVPDRVRPALGVGYDMVKLKVVVGATPDASALVAVPGLPLHLIGDVARLGRGETLARQELLLPRQADEDRFELFRLGEAISAG